MTNNQEIEIKIFASSRQQKTYDRRDENQIINVIRNEVLPNTQVEYHSVRVKVEREVDGNVKSLIAYMLRKDSYTADITKVDVDSEYNVETVQENYDDSTEIGDESEEESDEGDSYSTYDHVDFVAGTPVPEITSAKKAVEEVARLASNAGLTTKVLLGTDASVANYKHYLSAGLFGFVNVGHGWPGGIVLDDGRLRSTWFNGLTKKPISPSVVYFNSCQVFNPPLQPAAMSSGARTYIGGIVNLLIGASEEVCKSFWNRILIDGERMEDALLEAERNRYPSTGAHGISGDLEIFRAGHIIVFQHANFRGHHRHIFGMEHNLNHPEDRSLNDQISSFMVLSGTWKLYRHSNFRVGMGSEYAPGAYRWVEAVGVKNDQMSSLRCIKA